MGFCCILFYITLSYIHSLGFNSMFEYHSTLVEWYPLPTKLEKGLEIENIIAVIIVILVYCRTQNVSGHFNLANYSESILSLTFSNANKNVLML